jgi:hypothetical protein
MATPQPIALTGFWTIAAGPNNLQDNLPAASYPQMIAWAVDRTPDAGYMVSNGSAWTSNAGPPGTNGNTILSGIGAPASGSGVNGDFYVDVAASRMYGPKTAGVWGSGVSLVGPAPSLSSATPLTLAAAGAAGSGSNASRDDHVHPIPGLTASTPARALNTNFTPSATKWVWCSYSVALSVTNPLLAGSSSATVILLSDTAATPTTERARASNASSVALTVTVQITQPQVLQLSYLCPPGHNVRLSSSTSGTASASIQSQCEVAVG